MCLNVIVSIVKVSNYSIGARITCIETASSPVSQAERIGSGTTSKNIQFARLPSRKSIQKIIAFATNQGIITCPSQQLVIAGIAKELIISV